MRISCLAKHSYDTGFTYWWALLIPAVANGAWAFLTMQLVADPAHVGIETPEVKIRRAKNEAKRLQGETVDDSGPPPISYLDAIRIPMVAQYAIAFGFFKVRCTFYVAHIDTTNHNPFES